MPGFIHGHRCRPKKPGRKINSKTKGGFTAAYNSWRAMKTRCTNPRHERYAAYGGRGISFDPRWNLFESFYMDMGDPPSAGCHLARRDQDKDYCLDNCEWQLKAINSGGHR